MATFIGTDANNNITYQVEPSATKTMLPNTGVAKFQDEIAQILETVTTYKGQPVVVTSAEDMTEETVIYLYMGDEEGYNADHWYYYDTENETWTDGGAYVANPVIIDDTLTQAGEAADAKATGDEITQLKSDLSQSTRNLFDINTLTATGISISNNVAIGSAGAFNTAFANGIPLGITFEDNAQYVLSYVAKNTGTVTSGNGIRFGLNYTDGTYTTIPTPNSTVTKTAFSIVSDSNKTIESISMTFASGGTNVWELSDIQLEKGTEKTSYIPHITAVDYVARELISEIMPTADLFLIRKQLPDYYFGMPENPTDYAANDYMNERIKAVPDGKHFVFITDTHWKNNNAHNSTAMMKYVCSKLNIKNVMFGGDILNQETTKYMAAARMAEYMNEVRDAFGNNFFPAQGNHDLNVANLRYVLEDNPGLAENDVRMSYKVVYQYLVEPIADKVVFEDCSAKLAQTGATGNDLEELEAYCKLHYYHDDDEQKIRYIVVCTTNTDNNGVVNQYFGAMSLQEMYLQYDWIYQTLLDTPDNYDIFVIGHAYVWSGPEAPSGYRPYMPHEVGIALGRMMAGLRYKTNVTVRCATNNALLNSFYAYGAHTYAFANDSKTHHFVVGISGDKHFDGAYILGPATTIENARIYDAISKNDKEVLLTVTLCDARAVPEEDYNDYTPTMTAGTVNEQAFDVVTVTNDNRLVYTRFGSGTDRIFNIPL